ncbi:hypothetical protein EYF80_057605 [Liparis tanakae]|uniref:Uncharacterized protein n=1 Tax=Liparis tanakae TaxID=230148 RepID=A0A4Z2ETJ9_9TELE|nr:hypothetical protein EYF80_057605 [Liparis tanakae]
MEQGVLIPDERLATPLEVRGVSVRQSAAHPPANAGRMVKSWSSTLSRFSVFVLRALVTSGGFFTKELEGSRAALESSSPRRIPIGSDG